MSWWGAIYKNKLQVDQEWNPPVLGENVGVFLYNISIRICFLNITQNPDATKEKTDNWNDTKKYTYAWEITKIMTKS